MYYFLVSALLVLTSATGLLFTSLRVSDLAFLVLILWGFVNIFKNKFSETDKKNLYLLLPILLTVFLSIIYNLSKIINSSEGYDYLLIPGAIVAALVINSIFNNEDFDRIFLYYSHTLIVLLFLVYANTLFGWIDLNLDLTVDSEDRFSGLSKNPNQLALYLVPIPFFALYFFNLNKINFYTLVYLILSVFFINYLVVGKALFVSWGLGFLTIFLFSGLSLIRRAINFNFSFLRAALILLLLFFSTALFETLYSGESKGGQEGQGDTRLTLWQNGIVAGLSEPIFGNGPGHYSGIYGPFESMEAHNFFIDWFSAYGTLGMFFFFFTFFLVALKLVHYRNLIALSLLLTVCCQIMFHFYGRQPFFWILILIIFSFKNRSRLVNK